jgi:hypothetical protein
MTATGCSGRVWPYLLLLVVVAAATAGVTALLINVSERKAEARQPFVRLVEVDEDTTDPAVWGTNWPRQYDTYKRTAERTQTRFGGHGGSEALPPEKIERDPWLKRMFLGYAFSIDYRDRRGHAYMLADQEQTERLSKPQTGSCLHCHASIMPLYRKLGGGDAIKGFETTYTIPYADLSAQLHEMGHGHPVSCVDCHDPDSMKIRVTRPGFLQGIAAFAAGDAPAPHLPSVERWRTGSRAAPYDPNSDASRTEMRSFVCGQCHVEYYCSSKMKLTFPGRRGSRPTPSRPTGTPRPSPTASASTTTSTPRPARRSSRRSIPSSSSGARASTRAAAWPAPTATCPTCATARARSPTTGCAARCSTSRAPARPATPSRRPSSRRGSRRSRAATTSCCRTAGAPSPT